jgi:quinol monooxygenase YgiN
VEKAGYELLERPVRKVGGRGGHKLLNKNPMIRLNVFVKVKSENRKEVLDTLLELAEQSQKEKGCIAYGIFESSTDKEVLMICETWSGEEELSAHEKTHHFVTLVGKTQQLAEMKLERFMF